MVRFEDKLRNNAVAEWSPYYIDYRALKRLLYTKGATLETSRSPQAPAAMFLASPRLARTASATRSNARRRRPRASPSPLSDQMQPLLSGTPGSTRNDGRGAARYSDGGDSDPSDNMSAVRPDLTDEKKTGNASGEAKTPSIVRTGSTNSTNKLAQEFDALEHAPEGTNWTDDAWNAIKNAIICDPIVFLANSDDDANVYGSTGVGSSAVRASASSSIFDEAEDQLISHNGSPSLPATANMAALPSNMTASRGSLVDENFRRKLLVELAKVDTFYNDKMAELYGQLDILTSQASGTKELGRAKREKRLLRRKASDEATFATSRGSEATLKANRMQPLSPSANPASTAAQSEAQFISRDIESIRDMDSPSREALALESSKRAYADLYRTMCYLENYCILNYTAVVKIMKKHDKQFPRAPMRKILLDVFRARLQFMSFESLIGLKEEHRKLYAQVFCGGDLDVARAELLIKRDSRGPASAEPFLLGFRFGICLLLIAWIVWDVIVDFLYDQREGAQNKEFLSCHTSVPDANISIADRWFKKDFPVYRGMGSLVLWLWCWGASLFVWNHARINYLFMLELDPRTTATYAEVWKTASSLTIVLLTSFLIHFKVVRCDFSRIPPLGFWPILPFTMIVYKMFFPWRNRKIAWAVAFKVVSSPFFQVTFLMNFVGDVFTSLVKPIVDMTYSICFFVTGDFLQHLGEVGVCENKNGFWAKFVVPAIILGPYWFRFMQCIRRYFDTGKRHPNLPNAFKYALAMMVTIFSVFNPNLKKHTKGTGWQAYQSAWTTAYIVSTLYTYSWDVFMDWSLGDKGFYFLRERRMFSRRTYYYCAIVADLLLRFLWTYTLIPEKDQENFSNGVSLSLAVAPFAAAAEICRRTMWSFFRLENEHLNNTSGYRRVAHIPLHFETPLKPSESKKGQNKKRWTVILEIFVIVVIVIAVSCVAVLVKN